MHRFFVSPLQVGDQRVTVVDASDITHISRVLRLRVGDEMLVCNGQQEDYRCVLESIEPKRITAKILEKTPSQGESPYQVTLFQGVPKQGKLDTVVQKCTELGASTFVPVFMARSVTEDTGRFNKKKERLQTIAETAAKQCGRGRIPQVQDALNFGAMVDRLGDFDLVLFPYENEEGHTLKIAMGRFLTETLQETANLQEGENPLEASAENQKKPFSDEDKRKALEGRSIALVIGPEGGFALEEAAILQNLPNCACVTLGHRILRTETAGMATLAMLVYALEL